MTRDQDGAETETIVVATASHGNRRGVYERLQETTDLVVRTVETPALRTDDEAVSARKPPTANEPIGGVDPPNLRGLVVELEQPRPDALESFLDRLQTELDEHVPTVVAPWNGSEELAAAAVRADADDYVPLEREDDAVGRILEAIESRSRGYLSESEYHRIIADELPDEAFLIDEDGVYLETKMSPDYVSLYTTSPEELTGSQLTDAFPEGIADRLQRCLDRAISTGEIQTIEYSAPTVEGALRFEARVVPIHERIGGKRAVVWLARDITERARREQQLRSRRADLERINRINAVVRQVIETLVEAPTREVIEREVCEQLVDSELYCASWVVERAGDDDYAYRTGASESDTSLERVLGVDVDREDPLERAAKTGEIQATNHILESNDLPEPLEEAAREEEIRAGICVPIVYEDVTYGVLSVLARREDAFSGSEQASFELLGETMGFAIMALKNRQLLLSDSVVELEFRIDGGDSFSFDISERYDCTTSLEWAGTGTDGRTYQFVTIDGLDGETALEEAESHDSIEECRLIYGGDETCTLEMRLTESGVRTLANHGATIRDVTVESGVGTCLVEIPRNGDVREVAEALSFVYENTELAARREIDRPVRTAAERRDRILDELTERQLTTLRLAYYGGFFDWPRESTGEEIAEMMDVSPPTMHQHLRKALKTVLGEFFTESGRSLDDSA
ncbi:bacterio-opsin activator domain-containing protein [Natronobacterium gregoryi]|uniref:PAS domain S-box n=2 Tax=Natronobacterium gregoryi TaxID=44930 RepID=L0AEA1_NATGS|nr:bacterio-opsin activator domain-containing protein [Natronobacterium gregoryi]AFZ71390.1 PAS domain S-box [Natronobacterium gregoryi SP2]ELY66915.1 PAS sensor protein [Natronobacterium gregoryi SP2]PLK21231.1 PAS domain S-box protein [Natronobacterium gregoryi SP2]SFI84802.1 PAS domain S-box-containing protein [Natronobacterium gregoryi]